MSGPADVIISKGPCDKCGSGDNKVTYADGHEFCYSPTCGLIKPADKEYMEDQDVETKAPTPSKAVPFTSQHMAQGLKSRNLKQKTLARFGYFVHKENGKALQVAPYYSQTGEMVYQKYRGPEKSFWFDPVSDNPPRTKELRLYGQQVWGEKHDKRVVVTEGEHDTHAVAEATNFKVPVVSIVQGITSATDCLKANYRWLDRFDEIILWFDNDEPGQAVIPECANLFAPGKVKTIKVEGRKDAGEIQAAALPGDIQAAIWAATTWSPDGIVNASNCIDDMDEPESEAIAAYPFLDLEEKTRGFRESEVVYHVAGTGVGKTSIIVEHQVALIKQGVKFGVMRFEDTRGKSQLDIMGRMAERRLHLEDTTKEFRRELHSEVFDGGLVELLDPETADWSFDSILGYVRYMFKALDCKVVFIDPLSFLAAAANERDERKALDNVAYQFARLVKQTKGNLQVCHHLNRGEGKAFEEGGQITLKNIRGSGGIGNFSMSVFAYERDQQGPRPDLSRIRVLKCRFTGYTGIADTLKWDNEKGTLLPTNEPYPENEEKGSNSPPSFGSVVEEDY